MGTTQVRTLREQFARSVTISLTCCVALTGSGCATPERDHVDGRVERVVDGDTIVVSGIGTVRYIGVDTPELHHPREPVQRFAERARRANQVLVSGKVVRVVFEDEVHDAHGRSLGDVYVGGRFVNAELVRLGYGRILAIRPNTRHALELRRLQNEARAARRGIWGAAEGGVPWGTP
jgi:micrococcal nuclease